MEFKRDQIELYNQIDEILWKFWDPIGVNDIEDIRDEYQSYTPQILNLKICGSDALTIAEKLNDIEKKRMGLAGNINNCLDVAKMIIKL
jgi:hypothetical protein